MRTFLLYGGAAVIAVLLIVGSGKGFQLLGRWWWKWDERHPRAGRAIGRALNALIFLYIAVMGTIAIAAFLDWRIP